MPVTINLVTKHVKIPQIQYFDVPVVLLQLVPQFQTVLNTVEVLRSQFIDRFVPPAISQMTKHVEIQLFQYINKLVAVPVEIQRQVPQVQTVPGTAAVPTAHSVDRVVNVPVILQITQLPAVMFNQVTKHVETPQIHFYDQGVGVPLAIQRQVPRIQMVSKTVEVLSQFTLFRRKMMRRSSSFR